MFGFCKHWPGKEKKFLHLFCFFCKWLLRGGCVQYGMRYIGIQVCRYARQMNIRTPEPKDSRMSIQKRRQELGARKVLSVRF